MVTVPGASALASTTSGPRSNSTVCPVAGVPVTVATAEGVKVMPVPPVMEVSDRKLSLAGSSSCTNTSEVPLLIAPSGMLTVMVTGRVSPTTIVALGWPASTLSLVGMSDAPKLLARVGAEVVMVAVSTRLAALPPTGTPPLTKPLPSATPL